MCVCVLSEEPCLYMSFYLSVHGEEELVSYVYLYLFLKKVLSVCVYVCVLIEDTCVYMYVHSPMCSVSRACSLAREWFCGSLSLLPSAASSTCEQEALTNSY